MFSKRKKKSEGFVPSWLRPPPTNLDPEAPLRLQEAESDKKLLGIWRGPLGFIKKVRAGVKFRIRRSR